jgi:hypothetical protein
MTADHNGVRLLLAAESRGPQKKSISVDELEVEAKGSWYVNVAAACDSCW